VQILVTLLFLTIFLSVYDLKYTVVPGWVHWPLLAAGLLAHAPGSIGLNFSSVLLFLASLLSNGKFGAGDARLWLALLWLIPGPLENLACLMMFLVLALTAGLQMFVCWLGGDKRPATRGALPATWRTLVFMLLLNLPGLSAIWHV